MLFQIAATKSMAIDKGVQCSFPNLNHNLDYLNKDGFYNPKLNHSFEYLKIFDKISTTDPIQVLPRIYFPFEFANPTLPDDNFIIDGFFQSEKYFKNNRKEILDLVRIPEFVAVKISEKYSKFLHEKTTSIHVRRGDYLNHPNHHPVQSLTYYLNAIDLLKDKTDLFVIFSDDIEWCKINLNLENAIYIEDEKDYIELYLMSFCKNNIIANSSFSWWGAWLNENPDKTVIGPKNWFGSAIQHNTGDILPETWIKI
jgi:hypothetical protein